jgi:splicing factor U2AF subunit
MIDLWWYSVVLAGPPVCNVYINHEKFFAFVELKSLELTQACLGLDGIKYHHKYVGARVPLPEHMGYFETNRVVWCSGGVAVLRVRRASDFKAEQMPPITKPIPVLNLALLGVVSTTVLDGPGKIFIGEYGRLRPAIGLTLL